MGLGGQPHASAALYARGKDPVLIVQEAGWAPGPVGTSGKSHPHRIRSRTAQPVVSRYTDCATGPHRNKYILNNTKTVISGFHPWLLRNRISWVVSPCGWVIFSLFRRNVPPSCSRLWGNSRIYYPEDEGVTSLRYVGKQLSNDTAQESRRYASSIWKQVCN